MTAGSEIERCLRERGITRLTHFTNSRNLRRILRTGEILSTAELDRRNASYELTDEDRYDGHLGHVCCSVEYPNMYYFFLASGRPATINYSDWVILLIDPIQAARPGVLFSPVNAAKGSGRYLAPGANAFNEMFASTVFSRPRGRSHNPSSPTDVQAEVLIPSPIPLSAVTGIVVPDRASLQRDRGRLQHLGIDDLGLPWFTSSGLFRRDRVISAVTTGRSIPLEGPWTDTNRIGA
ncbi:DarT ssDNA thymidine ADP-ribosyltransferase family protein [Leifsonia sp. NPDC058248]|uniref:DarT ssDNA thymidine ADP-ribosyltransferase family protein n=1 Tax=Leifsonia sp. NPDC058248 TaxID=3346402 RepID=UPI0036DA4CF7